MSEEHTDPSDVRATVEPAPVAARHGHSVWRELPLLVIVAVVLAIVIKTFLVQAFYIPTASMENTLQGGDPVSMTSTSAHPFDRILVDKLAYRFRSPHRGEVVVFKQPPGWPPEPTPTPSNPVLRFIHKIATFVGLAPTTKGDFVKRVIGTPGDHVACCTAKHQITVNGKALNEPYIDLQDEAHSSAYTPFSITVPTGDLWVMGDHRDDSDDSRVNGPVPISDVVGRAILVIWPIKDWRTLPVPATFNQPDLNAAASPAAPFLAGSVKSSFVKRNMPLVPRIRDLRPCSANPSRPTVGE